MELVCHCKSWDGFRSEHRCSSKECQNVCNEDCWRKLNIFLWSCFMLLWTWLWMGGGIQVACSINSIWTCLLKIRPPFAFGEGKKWSSFLGRFFKKNIMLQQKQEVCSERKGLEERLKRKVQEEWETKELNKWHGDADKMGWWWWQSNRNYRIFIFSLFCNYLKLGPGYHLTVTPNLR